MDHYFTTSNPGGIRRQAHTSAAPMAPLTASAAGGPHAGAPGEPGPAGPPIAGGRTAASSAPAAGTASVSPPAAGQPAPAAAPDPSAGPVPSGPPALTIRISSPGSVVASIPLLFGFHPENSLVVLGLGRAPGGREHTIRHGVRIDLAQVRGNERVAAVELMQRLRDHGATEAVLVAYGPREATGPRARPDHCRKLMSAFVAQLGAGSREDRVAVVEAVFTTGSRWWSYMCRNARCCPAVGTVVPAGPPAMLTEAYVALGQTVFPSRSAMDATFDAYPMAVLRRTAKALTSVPPLGSAHWSTAEGIAASRALADSLLERQSPGDAASTATIDDVATPPKTSDPAIADDEVAHLLVALGEWRVRDYLAGAAATRENAARLLALATELARRAPRADLRLAPYTLAAWAAWALGRPSLAQCAVDRALGVDPECHFATLIRAGLHHAIDSPRVRMSAENTLLGLIGPDAEEAEEVVDGAPAGGAATAGPGAAESSADDGGTSGVPRQHRSAGHRAASGQHQTGHRSGPTAPADQLGQPGQPGQPGHADPGAGANPVPPQRAAKNRRLAKN